MKRLMCLMCGCWLLVSTFAQTPSLALATDKTTSLILPFAVLHVDVGTKDVLVQQVKEAPNILLVKAAGKNLAATNLSVITEDGSVYTFPVSYDANPSTLVWHITPRGKAAVATYASGLLDNRRTMHGMHDHAWDVDAIVSGIYIKDDIIFYQLRIDNHSAIDYDIALLKFYIRDKKKSKRTAVQENDLSPLYIAGNTKVVKANSRNTVVVALDKFTIPDAKYLAVQIMEKNGGRHLLMKVHNRKIVRAIALPNLR
ncbi:MAG: conjugative transposon protein TraN [Parafilimonas sp.]